MQIGDEEVLTLAQAAERLGISHHTLRNQVANGVMKARLMGKTYLVTGTEVERYRRDHLGKPGPKSKQQ